MDLSDLRIRYTKDSFSEADLLSSPFAQFEKWFSEALESKLDEPNALAIIWCVAQKASNTGCVALKDIIVVSVLLDRKQDTFCSGFRMSWAVS